MAKTIYTLGTECDFSNEKELYQFIAQHQIKEQQVFCSKYLYPILCFKHISNNLYAIIELEDDLIQQLPETVTIDNKKIAHSQRSIHFIKARQNDTKSWLGGSTPNELTIHGNSRFSSVDFQYIAHINKTEIGLNWLPFTDINLIYPFTKGVVSPIYYEYLDEKNIRLLSKPKIYEPLSYSLAEEAVFLKQHLRFESINETLNTTDFWNPPSLGFEGVPTWLQAPQYLKSPLNGKTMLFLCQFGELYNWKFANKQYEDHRDKFSLDGELYFFIEPESKVIAVVRQNT